MASRWFPFGALMVACGSGESGAGGGHPRVDAGNPPVDAGPDVATNQNPDGDCLSNAEELLAGTDPKLADTDGDGFDDCAELECGSRPADRQHVCYACGWKRGDPGGLVSTGAEEGDVIENIPLVDQCGQSVPLWDFAGVYRILFMTTLW